MAVRPLAPEAFAGLDERPQATSRGYRPLAPEAFGGLGGDSVPAIERAARASSSRRGPLAPEAFAGLDEPGVEAPPSLPERALHAVGTVVGAPKAGIDWLARQGARVMGVPVSDDVTAGRMIRAAAGLHPKQEANMGYAERLGGRALEFAGDM